MIKNTEIIVLYLIVGTILIITTIKHKEYLNKKKYKILILLLLGSFIGYILSYLILYLPNINKTNSKNNSKKLVLYWNKYKIHIHHWILFLAIILMTLFEKRMIKKKYFYFSFFYFFIGLCIGAIIEDFLYKDFFKIIVKNKN